MLILLGDQMLDQNPSTAAPLFEEWKVNPTERSDIVYKHLNMLQTTMDKYDVMGKEIRNWTITLWTATLIAGLIQNANEYVLNTLIYLSIIIPFLMGTYDGIFKFFRTDYHKKRNNLMKHYLDNSFERNDFEFPDYEGKNLLWEGLKCFNPFSTHYFHVSFIYFFLIASSIIIAWFHHCQH